MIRVGRITNSKQHPSFPNFKNIVCMTKSSAYGELSPYLLTNSRGFIMENIWQFSKVYEKVKYSKQIYSQWDRTVIWEHPEETHVDEDGDLTLEYLEWRRKGYRNKYPVRYPVGIKDRHKCLYSYWRKEKLDLIEARKKIYLPIYKKLVKRQPKFHKLLDMLKKGINLLIIEVDGPHQESLEYYKSKYNVNDNFIENDTILANYENLQIMLNDKKHSFGHGYCLAIALLEEISDEFKDF